MARQEPAGSEGATAPTCQPDQDRQEPREVDSRARKSGGLHGSGQQCDEYPFASTKEGATQTDNCFSVRLIDGKDNRKGGERLAAMCTLSCILDGYAFYMQITGQWRGRRHHGTPD
ncbi:NucA/NucB deoxyribonuclease domain-containing protein [Streptomyces sp. enrichment culture]|uniref:NucA/NucB deoxyribonuclease domain-containing protein n=1 Tax=Streptomyces sp. enrichment culture TaxID=1795815 RepID=UPI003F5594DB